jgi:ribonuclease P protein subunit POP4
MVISPHNITRHELIGLEIEVVEASNRNLVGKKGKVIDETRNTLTVRGGGKETRLLKAAIVFRTKVGGELVQVDGKKLVGRPEDRVKS